MIFIDKAMESKRVSVQHRKHSHQVDRHICIDTGSWNASAHKYLHGKLFEKFNLEC